VKFISILVLFALYGLVSAIGGVYFGHGNAPMWFAIATQYPVKETIWLVIAALMIGRAIYPSPLISLITKQPHDNQLSSRLGLALAGIIMLLNCYDLYSLQRISHPLRVESVAGCPIHDSSIVACGVGTPPNPAVQKQR
jgi:hypothetical protein